MEKNFSEKFKTLRKKIVLETGPKISFVQNLINVFQLRKDDEEGTKLMKLHTDVDFSDRLLGNWKKISSACTHLHIGKILSVLALLLSINSNIMLMHAATPKINPVGGEAGEIFLPGANTPSNQGQILQQKFLPSLTTVVIGVTGGLSLLFVIIGAIQILTAYGNDERLTSGKKTLTWALAGLLITILSYAIVQIIVSINFNPPSAPSP